MTHLYVQWAGPVPVSTFTVTGNNFGSLDYTPQFALGSTSIVSNPLRNALCPTHFHGRAYSYRLALSKLILGSWICRSPQNGCLKRLLPASIFRKISEALEFIRWHLVYRSVSKLCLLAAAHFVRLWNCREQVSTLTETFSYDTFLSGVKLNSSIPTNIPATGAAFVSIFGVGFSRQVLQSNIVLK